MSKAWQVQKRLKSKIITSKKPKESVQSEHVLEELLWNADLDNNLIPLGSLWPTINHSQQRLRKSLKEAPRCQEILLDLLNQVQERLQIADEASQMPVAKRPLTQSHNLEYLLYSKAYDLSQ